MSENRSTKTVTWTQLIAIVAGTMALFFLVAFVTKAVEAYQLRSWRNHLQGEISAMTEQRDVLWAEWQRRQSSAWIKQVLRDAGQVAAGEVRVFAVPASPSPALGPTAVPTAASAPAPTLGSPFNNPHWAAWQRLIWGFD
jgi:hypothetical protein